MNLRRLLVALTLGAAALAAAAGEGGGGRTPKPAVVIDSEEACVAPPAVMRRTHMDLLAHQRDKTLRQGVRGAPVSLNGCISCHASSKNGSVIGSRENFCQSCHAYAAVKIDCFDCHQAKAGTAVAGGAGGAR